ncbi:MAG: SIMPL domain-containing protein [Oligoflexia bacterium]|nr:SIMPL domain-containing protein [Oligoflexia bacterium]
MNINSGFIKALAVIALAFVPVTAFSSIDGINEAGDLIIVTGTGQIVVDPDLANVDISVVTKATTVTKAQELNSIRSKNLVTSVVSKFELQKDDYRTTNYSVHPEYTTQGNTQVLTGYSVTNSFLFTLRNLLRLGEFLDVAGATGGTHIGNISFGISNLKELQLQALSLAMNDARVKADVIAQTAGRAVTRAVKVIVDDYQVEAKQVRAADRRESTVIYAGKLSVSSSLKVEFEF